MRRAIRGMLNALGSDNMLLLAYVLPLSLDTIARIRLNTYVWHMVNDVTDVAIHVFTDTVKDVRPYWLSWDTQMELLDFQTNYVYYTKPQQSEKMTVQKLNAEH
jgi:hypothetical protein